MPCQLQDVSVKQMTQLKDQLMQQVDDWKSGHAMVMEHSSLAASQLM